MKRFIRSAMGAVVFFGASSAWAQQRDLEVTMDVVPANASAGAATGQITLPPTASARAQESSAFGHGTADLARDKGDLSGREFGQDVSEAAQARVHTPNLPPQSRRP